MSEKLFSVGEKLYELWSHRAKKLNNVKESGTKSFFVYNRCWRVINFCASDHYDTWSFSHYTYAHE